jgi:Ca2+-binding RTX toxin-like protein
LGGGVSTVEVDVRVKTEGSRIPALGLAGAAVALVAAALIPARADAAFSEFSAGVLTVNSSEGKVVPRCASDGELTVSGLGVFEGGPAFCRDLRRIEANAITGAIFDFSQLPDDLGGGQGPIEIHAFSKVTDPIDFSDDKFVGAPGHINIFEGGLGFDSITGGNLNDTLNGGADSDKVDGGGGKDTVRGGGGGDKLIGGLGADSLFGGAGGDKLLGGPGRDRLKGGGGNDSLVGGPGKDTEQK